VDALLAEKADKATTLEGYGITDAYKKTETYTQSEVQAQATNAANTAKDALRTELLGSSTDNDNTAPPTIYSVKNYATSVAAAALSTANTKADEKIAAALAWQPLSEM
jgi:phage-related tail fiber protein